MEQRSKFVLTCFQFMNYYQQIGSKFRNTIFIKTILKAGYQGLWRCPRRQKKSTNRRTAICHVRYALTNPYFPKIESRTSLFVVFVSCVYIYCDFACLIYTLLRMKLTEERVKSIVCDAVEIEREFVCDALPCALVALYVGGLYICGKIGWESVMKMGQDTRELFFNETFLYYNPLLLISAIFYLGPDHHSHKEIWKCARWMTTIILTSMTAYLYLYSHGDVSLAASQPV
ncbi:hypothetical protein YC2023_103751 [Brassica napus]|uniref:(rape) hypothetical protein n=1 Tax=Brassica napus TaxID=3708 RepID=A0A816V2D2_BRANA|nr:unnamed protein product [Brassica napus]